MLSIFRTWEMLVFAQCTFPEIYMSSSPVCLKQKLLPRRSFDSLSVSCCTLLSQLGKMGRIYQLLKGGYFIR